MLILSMKRVVILKGSKKVKVETVSTIKQVNAIVESYKRKNCTVKVYSIWRSFNMTLQEAKNYIDKSFSDYFTYGQIGSDIGTPIPRYDAMMDLHNMDDETWNNGTIMECDEEGNEI